MEKDQVVILEKRDLVLISGEDAEEFLQNIITNDIKKVSLHNSIFAALLTPQGKYLNEFFIVKNQNGYLLDCSENSAKELIENFNKYKLRSKVNIKDLSSKFVIGVINSEKFHELQKEIGSDENTINFRDTPIFSDPRNEKLGARILSSLENLYLTIKKLKLKIVNESKYYSQAHKLSIPEIGLHNLKDKLFGLEANFEKLQAIDFKKGCFIGQENTARMKLKNKLRKKLIALEAKNDLNLGADLFFEGEIIGKILINKPYPFAIINLKDSYEDYYNNKDINVEDQKVKLILNEKN